MKNILVFITILLSAVTASSQVKFDYDVDFEMNFDNREFYRSSFSESMTIFGARLTPAAGLKAFSADSASHRIMAGVDVMKDFGSDEVNKQLFKEIVIYYKVTSSEQLQEEYAAWQQRGVDFDYRAVSDFKGDASPIRIIYGTQATPTCLFISHDGTIKVLSEGLNPERFEEELNK